MPEVEGEFEYRVPAEWEPRAGTLLAWPQVDQAWSGLYPAVQDTFVHLQRLLREVEPVTILVSPDEQSTIARLLGGEDRESLTLLPLPTNDIWMRDAGPIGAWRTSGDAPEAVLLDGHFNAWGEKYPHGLDSLIPLMLARRWHRRRLPLPFRVEGGAVDCDGCGHLLTTESVLLDPNRENPGRSELEAGLGHYFGARHIHWLGSGLTGDDTDGHVDNLARFVAPGQVVCPGPDVPSGHPDADTLAEAHRRLSAAGLEVIALPVPEPVRIQGRHQPASYANFYLAADRVLLPAFGQASDQQAIGVMQDLFPDRQVVGLDARAVLAQGGAIHCLAQPLLW
ncbi:agmatine deiminase [Natronospira proteinivora]|uniref:Agmatine deiminase n=1 Tax=Natronospira proteinivora TaxID=1807133 RepID=A0ABT1GC46_9GAMM|nr:agmatine deiminase family protein [Natronospira proteinivora]MCP1727507.1 agmatine deiminase [Natronospira proteinivora]